MPTNPSIAPLAPTDATLDEKPAKPADDPLDPIEGATTRMTMPPEQVMAAKAAVVAEGTSTADLHPTDTHAAAEDPDAPAEDPGVDEEDDPTAALPEAPIAAPISEPFSARTQQVDDGDDWRDEAGARTWKPPTEAMSEERGAETDLDLSLRARLLRDANADTKPFIEPPSEEISLVPPDRVIVESSPAAAIPQPAASPREAEMMPEEATVADDPSLTMKGPMVDEGPTWSPGQQPKSLPPRMVIGRPPTVSQEIAVPLASVQSPTSTQSQPATFIPKTLTPIPKALTPVPKALTPVPFAAQRPSAEPERIVAARRAKTQIDDDALVEAALGSNQRYVITACFAILGLLAGIAAALFS